MNANCISPLGKFDKDQHKCYSHIKVILKINAIILETKLFRLDSVCKFEKYFSSNIFHNKKYSSNTLKHGAKSNEQF